jgi:hypothetical protein
MASNKQTVFDTSMSWTRYDRTPRWELVLISTQWLEAFVSNGTSQIQEMSMQVRQICEELGINKNDADTRGIISDIRNHLNASSEQNIPKLNESLQALQSLLQNSLNSTLSKLTVTIPSILLTCHSCWKCGQLSWTTESQSGDAY